MRYTQHVCDRCARVREQQSSGDSAGWTVHKEPLRFFQGYKVAGERHLCSSCSQDYRFFMAGTPLEKD